MPLAPEDRPIILGSLNALQLDVLGSGGGFTIGDIVSLRSSRGREGLARVANVTSTSGTLSFELEDGGYGFTANSEVLVSEKILTVANTELIPTLFETIYQPLANLHYTNANGTFLADEQIFAYHANNALKGTALIISVSASNSTDGYLFVEILSGSINDNTIFTTANAVAANLSILDGYTNLYATGNLIGWTTNTNLKLGLKSVNNAFFTGHFIYGTNSGISANLTTLSLGTGGSVSVSNSLLFTENVAINTDNIAPYANVLLSANDYGFPATQVPSENISTPLINALSFINATFGTVQTLVGINPGEDYTEAPLVFVYEPLSFRFQRKNLVFRYEDADGMFQLDEIIDQENTGARGQIKFSNATHLVVKEMRVSPDNWFQAGKTITGQSSNTSANVVDLWQNTASLPMGYNALINVAVTTQNGAVTELEVISSGFGFVNGETVEFSLRV